MERVQNMFSIYIQIVMLGIGLYMWLLQSKTLSTVNNLKKEAKFAKIVGLAYVVITVGSYVLVKSF